jgi:hypothetical protein
MVSRVLCSLAGELDERVASLAEINMHQFDAIWFGLVWFGLVGR